MWLGLKTAHRIGFQWDFPLRRNSSLVNVCAVLDGKVTADCIKRLKGKKFPSLTAYDFAMARLLDEAGVPLVLVGDSLAMVVLGYPDTTELTLEEMEHHVRAVARAKPRGLVAADMPARSYENVSDALDTAKRLLGAGAEAVKGEGGREIIEQVRAITGAGITFVGHLGMLPQHVKEEGGYKVKGKVPREREALLADAKALEEAGAMAMVLELVEPTLAAEITESVSVPTIGIGAGPHCDSQILVTTDLFGTSPDYIPRHVKIRPDLKSRMREIVDEWVESIR